MNPLQTSIPVEIRHQKRQRLRECVKELRRLIFLSGEARATIAELIFLPAPSTLHFIWDTGEDPFPYEDSENNFAAKQEVAQLMLYSLMHPKLVNLLRHRAQVRGAIRAGLVL
jgi:hypothetical protein